MNHKSKNLVTKTRELKVSDFGKLEFQSGVQNFLLNLKKMKWK